jgi:hypothetical protein
MWKLAVLAVLVLMPRLSSDPESGFLAADQMAQEHVADSARVSMNRVFVCTSLPAPEIATVFGCQ